MTRDLYDACPVCAATGVMVRREGEPPVQVDRVERCGACGGRGFVAVGLTLAQIDAMQVKAAAHDLLLKMLIQPIRRGDERLWALDGRLGEARVFATFDAARDAVYEALGLGGGR